MRRTLGEETIDAMKVSGVKCSLLFSTIADHLAATIEGRDDAFVGGNRQVQGLFRFQPLYDSVVMYLQFGNEISYGTFEVFAPGVPDNEEMNVEDGYHSMRL